MVGVAVYRGSTVFWYSACEVSWPFGLSLCGKFGEKGVSWSISPSHALIVIIYPKQYPGYPATLFLTEQEHQCVSVVSHFHSKILFSVTLFPVTPSN